MPKPRKSDAEKAMSGTLQPCRRRTVPGSEFGLTDEPPVGLTKEARQVWSAAIKFAPKGLLQATDFTVLERLARNYALYRKLAKQLDHEDMVVLVQKSEGSTAAQANPLFRILVQVQTALSACEKELGFTPVSRARAKVENVDEEANEFDDFEA